MQIGTKKSGIVETLPAQAFPRLLIEDFGVRFQPPDDIKLFPLGIVVQAGSGNQGQARIAIPRFDGFDDIGARAQADNLARFRWLGGGINGYDRDMDFPFLWVYLHNRIKLAEDFGHFIIC